MKLILLLMCLFGSTIFALPIEQEFFAKQHTRQLRQDLRRGDLSTLAMRSDQALNRLVSNALDQLRAKNEGAFADESQIEWTGTYQGFLTRSMNQEKQDIGDHRPLIEWLSTFYAALVSKLGIQVCKSTHLSDIETFNYTIPIVFHPCTFPMDNVSGAREDEYRRHFAQGAVYYGLAPVVTYWTADLACSVFSYGTGVVWLCGTIGDVAEVFMAKAFAPSLSDIVFERACPASF
jgi:hypothetical protein